MIRDTASDTADTADTARVTAVLQQCYSKSDVSAQRDTGSENGGRRKDYDDMVHFLLWWVH